MKTSISRQITGHFPCDWANQNKVGSRFRIPALSDQHVLDNVQLQTPHPARTGLPADFQHVEDAVIPRCDATVSELRQLMVLCRQIPDWRAKKGRDYPLYCLLAIMVMATLSGIVRGQRDLAAFAAKLTQFQLRALGSYRKRSGGRDYP